MDRIAPFTEGGNIADRIDEIVVSKASVHIEMLSETTAHMSIGHDVFTIYVEDGKLVIAWRDNEADAA